MTEAGKHFEAGGVAAPDAVSIASLEASGWTRASESRFGKLAGPLWQGPNHDPRRFGFIVEEKHDNTQGRVHGGMIMSACDEGMGTTAHLSRPDAKLFTISFECHFISGAEVGSLVEILSEVVHATKSLIFMRGTAVVGDRVIATCSGVWKVVGQRKATALAGHF